MMTGISFWQFPLSLTLALCTAAGGALLWRYLPDGRLRRALCGKPLAIVVISAFLVLMAIEGTWAPGLKRSPIMWTVAIVIMVMLGWVAADGFRAKRYGAGILSHAGLFLLLFGAFWGAPDVVDAQIAVYPGREDRDAITQDGNVVALPFGITLKSFDIEYYSYGKNPKQYTSTINIGGADCVTSVNHPCRFKGYRIYQYDYDRENGGYSVLKLVRDPWLPLVLAGTLLLAAGAAAGLLRCWSSRRTLPAMVALAVLFTVLSVARINFGTLTPALRSLWFIPHLAFYMLAYSALALALAVGIYAAASGSEASGKLSFRLLESASCLLLAGMLCGAVWAKAAWGDWWTWDAKECWAAVTWLFTLLGTHFPDELQKRRYAVLVCIILAFAAMQVAWYGVGSLPAAQTSLHAYTSM